MAMSRLALPRRTILRGVGAALSLPMLDAMVPAFATASERATVATNRLAVVYLPNGVILRDWVPSDTGKNFTLSPSLRPLAAFKDQFSVVSGTANIQGDPLDAGSGPHSRVSGCWLSGVRAKRTERADLRAGRTADQFAADVLGKDTPLRSLELALEPNYTVGGCEGGYSCTYINTFSWASVDRPLPMETNPSVVFERLFGEGGTGSQRLARMKREQSILDSLTGDLVRLQKSVGAAYRQVMEEYVDAVRDVERRIQQTGNRKNEAIEAIEQPFGIPALFEDHAKLMFDLTYLAFRTDMTRVVTFQLARELSLRSYPELGVPEAHHDISHHGNQIEKVAKKAKVDAYHVGLVGHLLKQMSSTPDGDGTLLDHAAVLIGGGMGDGNMHSPHNLPVVVAGKASGRLKPAGHLKATFDTPFMNVALSVLDAVDVRLETLGDSTGRLAGL